MDLKAYKKRRIGIAVLGSIIIIVVAALIYCKHMNFWPFQGDKIAGLPDDHLKIADKKVEGPVSLLFVSSGEILFNSKAKYISAYIDYYEKDKRKKRELLTQIGVEKAGMNGTFDWGMFSKTNDAILPSEGRIKITKTDSTETSQTFKFPVIKWEDQNMTASSFHAFSSGKIKLGRKYIIQTWATDGRAYGEAADILSKKTLQHSKQTIIFYIVFK